MTACPTQGGTRTFCVDGDPVNNAACGVVCVSGLKIDTSLFDSFVERTAK